MSSLVQSSLTEVTRVQRPSVGIEQVWQAAALAAPFIVTAGTANLTNDTWTILEMGRVSVETGRPLTDQVLGYAPTLPNLLNGQWLGQVVVYVLYAGLGEIGVRLVAGFLFLAAFGLLLVLSRQTGGSARASALALMLATLLASSNASLRAQVLAFPLFAFTYLALELGRRRPTLCLLLPPAFALWSNLHGSFVFGLLLMLCFVASDLADLLSARARLGAWSPRPIVRPALTFAFCLISTAINPHGFEVFRYVLQAASTAATAVVEEWQPTTVQTSTGLALAVCLVTLVVVLRVSRRPLALTEVLLLLAFGYLAFRSQRYAVWYGLVAAPVVARHLSAVRLPGWGATCLTRQPVGPRRRPFFNLALVAGLVLVAGLAPVWRPALAEKLVGTADANQYAPAAAADFMAGLPVGSRLYQYQPWSGYLGWRLWPRLVPFLDARAEAHSPAVWADFLAVSNANVAWQEILDRYAVDYLVLDRFSQRQLSEVAAQSGRWTTLFQDEQAIVLGRRQPS